MGNQLEICPVASDGKSVLFKYLEWDMATQSPTDILESKPEKSWSGVVV